jgi:aromatic ring-opening dioxygenase LigB subunit
MLEETRQTNAVIRKMWFLANNHYIVISPSDIVLHEFLAVVALATNSSIQDTSLTHINAMPTMPKPTTTILFRG